MNKLKRYTFTFEFACEREPIYEEKMEIASKGLNALHDIVYEVIGEPAHHNMDFGFYDRYCPKCGAKMDLED